MWKSKSDVCLKPSLELSCLKMSSLILEKGWPLKEAYKNFITSEN